MKARSPSSKVERKVVERDRRIHMKNLCFKLSSLVPSNNPKEVMSQPDQVHEAINYIKELHEKIEKMKEKKEFLTRNDGVVLKIQTLDSSLAVAFISGLNQHLLFYEVITVIEEEGAEVLSANFSTSGDKVFHTIHSQVKDYEICFQTARITERLMKLVQ